MDYRLTNNKDKMSWILSEAELNRFLCRFEECEVLSISKDDDFVNVHILTLDCINFDRQWALSDAEYNRFKVEFEECEVI